MGILGEIKLEKLLNLDFYLYFFNVFFINVSLIMIKTLLVVIKSSTIMIFLVLVNKNNKIFNVTIK